MLPVNSSISSLVSASRLVSSWAAAPGQGLLGVTLMAVEAPVDKALLPYSGSVE